MVATQSFPISKSAQEAFIEHHKYCLVRMRKQWNFRQFMEEIDRAYLSEQDLTEEHLRAKSANKRGNSNRIQNVTIPIVAPHVHSAVQYQMAVFLDDYPIMGVVADPRWQDQAMALQALVEENSIRASWARQLMLFFYDGMKYNLSALECSWDRVATAKLETNLDEGVQLEGEKVGVIWQGNALKRWDPYNTYFDSSVCIQDIPSRGEFVGTTELYTKTALKTLIASLPTKLNYNIKAAFESPCLLGQGATDFSGHYVPYLNSQIAVDTSAGGVGWTDWIKNTSPRSGAKINYQGIYEVSTEYVRIIPADLSLNVPQSGTPQIWKLMIVNHSVVIHAERQTNAHEKIPVLFGQPVDDGLGYQAKSPAANAIPFQQTASALMNGVLAGRRRAVGDRLLYDPSRVSQAHMENASPTARIPVKPAAYGKPLSESIYPIPFRDDQAGIGLQEIQQIIGLADRQNGQNPARQGQFVKGNKTDSQWNATMMGSTGNDRAMALTYEAQVFTPLKEILKLNYLQYQPSAEVYSSELETTVQIDPVELRKAALNFKVTDGYLPKDKVISKEALQVAMQVLGTSQLLGNGYNVAPLFSYIMKTENVNLKPFEKSQEQIAYEQAMASWQQMATLAIQKGVPFNVPQPVPQSYGFNPQAVNPTSQVPTNGPTEQ